MLSRFWVVGHEIWVKVARFLPEFGLPVVQNDGFLATLPTGEKSIYQCKENL